MRSIILSTQVGSNQFNAEFRAAFGSSITAQLCIVYTQRWGKRKETYSRSSLNELGDLLFLGGTFRLLALAAGAGGGRRGERTGGSRAEHKPCGPTTGLGARNSPLPPWP